MAYQLLNYTTEVAVEKTVGEVLALLLARGAAESGTLATNRKPTGVRFVLDSGHGPGTYRMDVNVDRVEERLLADHKARKIAKRHANRDQAERTAWRNLLALLRVFFDVADSGQFKADELLLPWVLAQRGLTAIEVFAEARAGLPSPPKAGEF